MPVQSQSGGTARASLLRRASREEWTMPDKGKSGPKGKGGAKPPPGKTGKGKK